MRQWFASLSQQRQDEPGRVPTVRLVPPGRRAHLDHGQVYVGLEQPYGGVHGVNVENQLPEPGLHLIQIGGDLLALADQAGKNGVADRNKIRVHVSRDHLQRIDGVSVDQTILELFSRLTAIEYMLMHLQKLSFQSARLTPEGADLVIQASIARLKDQAYPGFPDPAESDQYAAAVEEHITTLLHGAKAMLVSGLEQKE